MGKYLQIRVALFVHALVCLTTGPKLLLKRVPQRTRASASSFNLQCLIFSLKLSSSCLRLLHRLLVTYILPSIFLAIKGRRQFLSNMWPIQLAFLPYFYCLQHISLLLESMSNFFISYTIGPADLHPSPAQHFNTFQVFLNHKSYCSTVHFRRITSIYQPTNAHIISRKTLFKHFKILRHVSILSDHHQGWWWSDKIETCWSVLKCFKSVLCEIICAFVGR